MPAVVLIAVFNYAPMYGIQIAFKNYSVTKGLWGSTWVGLTHFSRFWKSYYFKDVMVNTLALSVLQILIGIPRRLFSHCF